MRIALLCDLTNEHWVSMDRYALALSEQLRRAATDLDLQLIRPTRSEIGQRGKADRVWGLLWKHLFYPIRATRIQSDLYHIIDHSYAHLAFGLPRQRLIITCHDLAPLALDEPANSITLRLWKQSIKYLRKASQIITPSANTVRDLTRFLDISSDKATVIPYGIGPEFKPDPVRRAAVRQTLNVPDSLPLILHLGSCIPRKNIPMLLRALGQLSTPFLFLQVGGQFSPADLDLIHELALTEKVKQINSVPLDRVLDYYNAADVLAFPSKYEGFGLPPLEAMACGTPVIATQTSSLPEVVGEAGLLVSPDEPQELAAAIQRVLSEPGLAAMLRERGLKRASHYTWERAAHDTLSVYKKVWATVKEH